MGDGAVTLIARHGLKPRAKRLAPEHRIAAIAGIAGVVLASRVGISQPSVAVGYELDAIAACVIGGAILGGGGGSVRGTFAGVLVLGLISNLLNMYNVQAYYQQIFKGVLIVLAVLARRKER